MTNAEWAAFHDCAKNIRVTMFPVRKVVNLVILARMVE